MKRILLFIALTGFSAAFAQFVSADRAKKVAVSLLNERSYSPGILTDNEILNETLVHYKESPVYHIVNFSSGGFVLVAADERVNPVLGYSFNGDFSVTGGSDCLGWLLDHYKKQIHAVIAQNLPIDNAEINNAWEKYESGSILKSNGNAGTMDVSPLTTTTWSQGCYYNQACPSDVSLGTTRCGRVPTGCVATAFGQVMKYHNHPSSGVGSNTYSSSKYGTLSANFANTTYNWSSMPNKLLADNQAVSLLLFHAGVAIDMDYGPNGSSAYTTDVRKALVNNFKYASSTQHVSKSSYSDAQWENLIRTELDAQRIVIISGYDPNANAGHAFIADGYQGTNSFHINWGWNGSSDGYFLLTALSPANYAFNSNVGAIIGIKPASASSSTCSGTTTLTSASGSFSDGSSSSDYEPNRNCNWLIKPTGAGSVTLTFSTFSTESGYDFVKVYNGSTTSSPLLGSYSGNTLPAALTSTGGQMLVVFTSDGTQQAAGWSASYTSATAQTYCSGTTTLTGMTGNLSDGSGSKNYGNNSDCYWLINPPNAQTVKLSFSSFNTESGNDKLYVYNGTTTNAPLLGTYSGSSKPSPITASSGTMLIRFTSNGSVTKSGWAASYTSQTSFCSGTTTLTSSAGTITDGSGSQYYDNNASCKWIIKPSGASQVTLTFSAFNTESGADLVKIYNGETTSSPLIATLSGSSVPAPVTANAGKMLVHFTSNSSTKKPGFTATYGAAFKTSELNPQEALQHGKIEIFPNPNSGYFTIKNLFDEGMVVITVTDMLGKIIFSNTFSCKPGVGEIPVDIHAREGIYFVTVEQSGRRFSRRMIVNAEK